MKFTLFRSLLFPFSALLLAGCDVEVFITGEGQVTTIGADAATCNTAPACFAVSRGETVTLQATPDTGFSFAGWGGECASAVADQCTLTVGADKRVQATFLRTDYTVTKPLMQPDTEYFFTAPWPNDAYSLDSDGTIDASKFPLPEQGKLDSQIRKLAANQKGFATNGGAYFQFDQAALYSVWSDYLYSYNATNPQPGVAFFLNIDNNSEHYGEWTPAEPRRYMNYDKLGGIEQQGLLLLSVAPGFPLQPGTRYAAVILQFEYDNGKLVAADGLAQLKQAYSPAMGYSEALFSTLVSQKSQVDSALTLSGVASPEKLAAFTVFTTQEPLALDKQLGNTINALTEDEILSSVDGLELVQDCDEGANPGSKHFAIKTHLPDFMTGSGLHLLGGGKIEITNEKAVIQGAEMTDLLLTVPCLPPSESSAYPMITHAVGTGESWQFHLNYINEDQYIYYRLDRNAIHLALNAPFMEERRPASFEGVDDLLQQLGVDINLDELVNVLVDLNFVNLEAARNQHLQYGADLHYASRVAALLPRVLERFDTQNTVPEWASQTPASFTLSGSSLGGLAVLHALAQGAYADNVTTAMVPRPNYIHIDSIFELVGREYPEFSGVIQRYSGVQYGDIAQPLLLWLQSVMEPIDSANYVSLLNVKPLVWELAPYDDYLHGQASGYSIIAALQHADSIAAGVELGDYYYYGFELYNWYVGEPFTFDDTVDAHIYGKRFVVVANDYDHNVMRCFPSALVQNPEAFGPLLNQATLASKFTDCRFE